MLSSSALNPVRPIGSAVTLNCTVHVELSLAVDAPVTVNTVWTGLDGFRTTNTLQPDAGGTTTYTSTAMISSFGRNQSGVYTCAVILSSSSTNSYLINSSTTSDSIQVTTREILKIAITSAYFCH